MARPSPRGSERPRRRRRAYHAQPEPDGAQDRQSMMAAWPDPAIRTGPRDTFTPAPGSTGPPRPTFKARKPSLRALVILRSFSRRRRHFSPKPANLPPAAPPPDRFGLTAWKDALELKKK